MIKPSKIKRVSLWRAVGNIVKMYKEVIAVVGVLGTFLAWNNNRVTKGHITQEQFNEFKASVITVNELDSTLDDKFDDYDYKLNMRGERFVKTYVQPMLDTDQKLALELAGLQQNIRAVINAQHNVSKDIKQGLLNNLTRDSIVAENARLKAQVENQAKVEEILEELKRPEPAPPRKKRRDKIE